MEAQRGARPNLISPKLSTEDPKIANAKPKDAKRTPFGRLRMTDIDTLTQRLHTLKKTQHRSKGSTSVQFDLFCWYLI